MVKRKSMVSPATRRKRVSAGSKYPKVYLTPTSLAERVKNEKVQAMADKKTAKKLRRFDIDVNDITSQDLIAVVAELERTSKDTLEQLLLEADFAGIGITHRKPRVSSGNSYDLNNTIVCLCMLSGWCA